MRNSLRFSSSLLLTVAMSPLALAQITPGNLLVSRVGDGSGALTAAAAPRFLDEYTPAGVFVQTITLPVAAAGANLALTAAGNATSEGYLSQSADGRYMVVAGYNAAPATAGIAATLSTATARVVGRIALVDGSVDTSTGLTDAYSGSNIRSACSYDGLTFWAGGTGSGATPGVRFAALGGTTSTQLSTTVTNTRVVNIANGQLYVSTGSGSFLGVNAVGTGLPTTSGQTIAQLAGLSAATGLATYDYFFADANTLYIADERTTTSGGIQKWTLIAGVWTFAYALNPPAATPPNLVGCRGLSGYTEAGVTTLFATTTANKVVSVVDTGAGSLFTDVVTGATNTALRDVQWVRTPSNVIYSGTACPNNNGTPTVGISGLPVAGNASFAVTAGNCGAGSLIVYLLGYSAAAPVGINLGGTPPCALLYVFDVIQPVTADGAGNGFLPIPVPNSASLGGFATSAQVAPLDFSLVGYDLPVGTSNAMTVILGN